MPSTGRSHTLSRRRLLSICGTCAGVGTLAGYAYGSEIWRDDDCDPSPVGISPTDWPLPNYDGENTRTAPVESAPAPGLIERWNLPHRRSGQPIVIDGSVLIVPEARSPEFLLSHDLFTGEEQWTRPISASGPSFSFAAGGDALFLPADSEGGDRVSRAVAAADGSERWVSDVTSHHVIPLFESGVLVFRDDPNLIAIDARTGEECWRTSIERRLRLGSTVTYAGENIVLDTGTEGELIALDGETGERHWEADISVHFHPNDDDINDAIRGHIVAGSNRVFFHTFGGLLIALDRDTGETDWVTPETHPETSTGGGSNYAPPALEPIALSDDVLVVIESDSTDRSDILHAIDPTTGGERWTFEPEAEEDASLRSAAIAGETVFLPVMDELILIDLASGEVLETHGLEGYARSITLADGTCLVATTEGIVAFEEE